MNLQHLLEQKKHELKQMRSKAELVELRRRFWDSRFEYCKREIQHSVQSIASQTNRRELDQLVNAQGRTISTVLGKDVTTGGLGISAVRLHLLNSSFPQYYQVSPPEESEAYAMIKTMLWLSDQLGVVSSWPLNRETYEWIRFGSAHSHLLRVDHQDTIPRPQRSSIEHDVVEFSHRLDAFPEVFRQYPISIELMDLPCRRALVPTGRSGIANLLDLVSDWGPIRLLIAEELAPQRRRLTSRQTHT